MKPFASFSLLPYVHISDLLCLSNFEDASEEVNECLQLSSQGVGDSPGL